MDPCFPNAVFAPELVPFGAVLRVGVSYDIAAMGAA